MVQFKCNGQIQSESESRWNAPHEDTSYDIVMRPDIYKAFDDRLFTIVREKSSWVVHLYWTNLWTGCSMLEASTR